MKSIDDARTLIENRLSEVIEEAKDLERALKHLTTKDRKDGTRSRGFKQQREKKRRGRKQAKRGQRREQLLAEVKANPGIRAADLARKMNASPSQVHGLLRKAQADKLVVKKGQGYAVK